MIQHSNIRPFTALFITFGILIGHLNAAEKPDGDVAPLEKYDEVLVGVSYFAGWWKELPNKWHGQGFRAGEPDWRLKFPERVPTLGEYNEQATMDREIIAASSHGVDFFAILYYYPKPGSKQLRKAPLLNRGLEQFIASPEAHRMKFAWILTDSSNSSIIESIN